MNLFNNLSSLLKWTEYSFKDKQDSDLKLSKVALNDFNTSTLSSL
jgi:hypothetical protein